MTIKADEQPEIVAVAEQVHTVEEEGQNPNTSSKTPEQPQQEEKKSCLDWWTGWRLLGATFLVLAVLGVIAYFLTRDTTDDDDFFTTSSDDYAKILEDFDITDESSDEDLQNALDAMNEFYLEYGDCEHGGSVLGVTRGTDRRIFSSIGVSNIEAATPMTPDTTMEVASVSEALLGLVLAQQITLGKISLETPLNDILPDDIPDLVLRGELVTIRQLVTHTAGFPRKAIRPSYDFFTESPYTGLTEQDLLDQIKGQTENELNQVERVWYSEFGLSILAYVLGRNANSTFVELQQELVNELNMTSTFAGSSTPMDDTAKSRLATGYWAWPEMVPYYYESGVFADGVASTVSSASDVVHYLELLLETFSQDSNNSTNNPLQETLQLSLEILQPNENVILGGGMGFGWFAGFQKDEFPEQTVYFQGGSTAGFTVYATLQEENNFGFVAMSNCGERDDVAYMGAALAAFLIGDVEGI